MATQKNSRAVTTSNGKKIKASQEIWVNPMGETVMTLAWESSESEIVVDMETLAATTHIDNQVDHLSLNGNKNVVAIELPESVKSLTTRKIRLKNISCMNDYPGFVSFSAFASPINDYQIPETLEFFNATACGLSEIPDLRHCKNLALCAVPANSIKKLEYRNLPDKITSQEPLTIDVSSNSISQDGLYLQELARHLQGSEICLFAERCSFKKLPVGIYGGREWGVLISDQPTFNYKRDLVETWEYHRIASELEKLETSEGSLLAALLLSEKSGYLAAQPAENIAYRHQNIKQIV